jgi:hypothetical protein
MKKLPKTFNTPVKQLPKSFGTKVNLEDFYDYNDLCINHLKHVYDALIYVTSQLELTISNHETPDFEEESKEELDLDIERLRNVVSLINHFNSNVFPEQVALERHELQAQLDKVEYERARLVKELKKY